MPLPPSALNSLAAVENFLQRRGFWILALAALFYYGSYYDTGLTLTGERGSNVLIAQRILAGERPFIDVFPGYNLLWFYPMSAIYAVIGPHWLATRIYFLLLAVVTALMGYALVRRATGRAWLAMIAGVFMVLMPGAIFRNYMGFIGVLAMTFLLRGYVFDAGNPRRQILWMTLSGAAMAVCFLIRIEPSLLMSLVWIGLVALYPFCSSGDFLSRTRTAALGTLGGLLAFSLVHAPFVADSYRRGFGPQFTSQYTRYIDLLRWELKREWEHWMSADRETMQTALTTTVAAPVADANPTPQDPPAPEASGRDGRRAILPISEIISDGRIYFFAAALWLPVLVAPVLVLSGTVLLVASLIRGDRANKTRSLVVLTTTGCALSLFPQYFFFRPDSVHLNEFLVAFWPASICSAWAIWQAARDSGSRYAKLWSVFVSSLVVVLLLATFNALFGRDGSGSIMGARGEDAPFRAMNGVQARVKPSELEDWQGLYDAVTAHAAPGEYVFAYPYVPIVNVMCDRPTYQWSLYIDNATASSSFQKSEGEVLRGPRKPAVIVVNDRAINKTEQSRFSNWAADLYAQIRQDYRLVGTFFDEVEVFALRDHADTSGVSPGSTQ